MKKIASVLLSLVLTLALTGTTGFDGNAGKVSVFAISDRISQTATVEKENPFAKLDDARRASTAQMVGKYAKDDSTSAAQDTASSAEQQVSSNQNSFNVKFKSTISFTEIYTLISTLPYKMIGSSSMRTFTIQADSEEALRQKLQGSYDYIEQDGTQKEMATANDPKFSSQWALPATNILAAWDTAKGSANVTVAMIDSGICRTNEDLANANILNGKDYLRSKATVTRDTVGHGTNTTGIIAAVTNNGIGISGVCWNVTILPMLVLDSTGSASTSIVASAIYDSADAGADVINLSLGGAGYTNTEKNAVAYAISKGCIIVAAAGNAGDSIQNYPASFDGVISVASIDNDLEYSSFSTYNDKVDVAAPGANVLTTADKSIDNVDYKSVYGTSFSSPYVAGIAALARSCNDSINSDTFLKILKLATTDKGDPGYDPHYGYGIVDAKRVVTIANNLNQNWDYPYVVNGSTAQITGYVGAGGDVVIPSTLGGYPVTSIGTNVFYNCDTITSITIPSGITSIGSGSFQYCDLLSKVTFLGNVTNMGTQCFTNCKLLTMVTLGSGVTNVGTMMKDTFDYLLQISVDGNNPVYSSMGGVLYNLSKSELVRYPRAASGNITVQSSVTSITDYAFYLCTKLSAVTIPDTVTTIGKGAFSNCTSLTSVILPNGLTKISDEMFLQCGILTSVTIPAGVTQIGSDAFNNCGMLKGVILPNTLTDIGSRAFYNCSLLGSIIIPPSVTNIGDEAFLWGIYTIYFQGNAPTLGNNVFVGAGAFGYRETTINYNSVNTGFTNPWYTYTTYALNPPLAPIISLTSKTTTSITISWEPIAGVDGYYIYNGGDRITPTLITATSYTLTGLSTNMAYDLTVKAYKTFMESSGNLLSVTTDAFILNAPTDFTANSKTSNSVSLAWSPVSGAAGYIVYNGAIKMTTAPILGTAYTATGLSQNTAYTFTVKAVYMTTESPASAPVYLTTDKSPGNVNGDSTVDLVDVTALSRYLAGWSVQVDPTALDVNADGNVDLLDVTLLSRYVAGWSMVLN